MSEIDNLTSLVMRSGTLRVASSSVTKDWKYTSRAYEEVVEWNIVALGEREKV
jgi:hypothetical protein